MDQGITTLILTAGSSLTVLYPILTTLVAGIDTIMSDRILYVTMIQQDMMQAHKILIVGSAVIVEIVR